MILENHDNHYCEGNNIVIVILQSQDNQYCESNNIVNISSLSFSQVAQHLANTYGDKAPEVAKLAALTGKRWPVVGKRLVEEFPYLEAEVRRVRGRGSLMAITKLSPLPNAGEVRPQGVRLHGHRHGGPEDPPGLPQRPGSRRGTAQDRGHHGGGAWVEQGNKESGWCHNVSVCIV